MCTTVILRSIQVILVPFRPWLTAGTNNIDISGDVETLENINVLELIISISSVSVVVERVRVILLVTTTRVKFHVKALCVVVHVTTSLSPT